jgi:hypothetical protein
MARYRRVNPRRRRVSIDRNLTTSREYNQRHVDAIRAAEKFLAAHPDFKRTLGAFLKIFRRHQMHGGDFLG